MSALDSSKVALNNENSKFNKIELYTNNLDRVLLNRALEELRDRVTDSGDVYGVAGDITNLLIQLKENN